MHDYVAQILTWASIYPSAWCDVAHLAGRLYLLVQLERNGCSVAFCNSSYWSLWFCSHSFGNFLCLVVYVLCIKLSASILVYSPARQFHIMSDAEVSPHNSLCMRLLQCCCHTLVPEASFLLNFYLNFVLGINIVCTG